MRKLYLSITMLLGVVMATYSQTLTPRNNITGYPTFLNNHRDSVGVLRNTGGGVGAYGRVRIGEMDTAAIRAWLGASVGGSADGNNLTTGISFTNQRLTLTRSGLSSLQADIDTGFFARRDWVRKINDSMKVVYAGLYQPIGASSLPSGGTTGQVLTRTGSGSEWATIVYPPTTIADVTGLQAALDGKQVAGSYAAASHSHVIGDVTGLSTALGLKVNFTDTAAMLSPYLRSAAAAATYQPIGSYAAASHTHIIANVTGLQAALDGKQATLVSGTNIKTINGNDITGSGNVVISGGISPSDTAAMLSGYQRLGLIGLPTGGTTGQGLFRTGSGYEWATPVYPPTTVADVTGLQDSLNGVRNASALIAFAVPYTTTITSGTAGTVADNIYRVDFDPTSVIATYTLTLPAAPSDGQRVIVRAGRQIAAGANVVTTFTVSANAGQSFYAAITPTRLSGGDVMEFEYETSTTTWTRIR